MRQRLAVLVTAGVLLAGSNPAAGKDTVEGPLAAAKKGRTARDVPGAAAAFGQAMGAAAKMKDLEVEQQVTDEMESWFDEVEKDGAGGTFARDALAGVMKGLDPAESGAF